MTSEASITATPPTLPTELIEDILAQDSLSTADFARCCIVSRQFLSPARRLLYSSIRIFCYLETISQPVGCYLAEDSVLLVETLRSSSMLRSLVKAVHCYTISAFVRDHDLGGGAIQVLEELLETLPEVNQLSLRAHAFNPLWNYILSRPSKWISLGIQSIDQHSVFHANTPFTNLEKLRCGRFPEFDNSRTLYLPPRLTHLDLRYIERQPSSILNAASSPLRFLRLSTRHFVESTDFSKLPHLQHLALLELGHGEDNDRKLGGLLESCRHLISLTIDWDDWILTADLSYFLGRLPVSLLRINFSYYVPFESLNDLLEKGLLKSVRIIGVSEEGCSRNAVSHGSDTLKRLCGRRGIKLEDSDKTPSVFDF